MSVTQERSCCPPFSLQWMTIYYLLAPNLFRPYPERHACHNMNMVLSRLEPTLGWQYASVLHKSIYGHIKLGGGAVRNSVVMFDLWP